MFSTHLILTGQQGFDVAIKALEQEPCTVDSKPIVQAHWIEGQTDNPNIHNILCSCCFEGYLSKGHDNSQYTKERLSCGSKMDENEYILRYSDEDTMISAT